MWTGPIHDPSFVNQMLANVAENPQAYKTSPRIEGMLSVATTVGVLTAH